MAIIRTLSLVGVALLYLAAGAREAHSQIAIVNDALVEREAAPGESYEGVILVRNTGGRSREAKLYLTDYAFDPDRSTYAPPGTSPRSNARWVTLSQTRVLVPPGQTLPIRYTVAVPAGAARPLSGSYWSMVMVEEVSPDAPDATGRAGEAERPQIGVRSVIRYGVQVVTNIGRTGSTRLEVLEPKLLQDGRGVAKFQFEVQNGGERARRVDLTLELYTESGAVAGRFASSRGLLYPGTSLRQRFDLPGVAPGTYRALLVADAGEDAVFGSQYTLTIN